MKRFGLIADVDYEGGGIHRIKNGGRLELHSDYNKHPTLLVFLQISVLTGLIISDLRDFNTLTLSTKLAVGLLLSKQSYI